MNNCKKKCLIQDCIKPTKYYVNYSRYHRVCEEHKINENQFIICSICNNKIQCYEKLEISCKEDAKSSPSIKQAPHMNYPDGNIGLAAKVQNFAYPIVAAAIPKTHKEEVKKNLEFTKKSCNYPNCPSKKAKNTCKEHSFCDYHYPKNLNYCSSCKCIRCKMNSGCYLYDCGPLCEKCKNLKCCFACAATDNTKQVEKCKHYLCEKHFNKNYFCYCIKCSNCHQGLVNTINSSNLLCDNCSQKTCPQCNQKSSLLYTNKCSHEKCADCFSKPCNQCAIVTNIEANSAEIAYNTYPSNENNYIQYPVCDICQLNQQEIHYLQCQHKLCTRCIETYPALCQKHLLCALCTSTNQYCPYCWNCFSCKKTVTQENPLCSHSLCEECRAQAFCERYQFWFCKVCNIIRTNDIIICEHGLCQTCETDPECKEKIEIQKKQYLEYYYSAQIHNEGENIGFIDTGIIIDEEFKEKCLFCKAQINGDYICPQHPFCGKCEVFTGKYGCPYCNNYIENVQCKACKILYNVEDLKRLECSHIMCNSCLNKNYIAFTKTSCIECLKSLNKKCMKCHQGKIVQWYSCQHGFCQACSKENCRFCTKISKMDKVITLSNKLNLCNYINHENHEQICNICNPTYTCIRCKNIHSNKVRSCIHKICENCLKLYKCDICDIDLMGDPPIKQCGCGAIHNSNIVCKSTLFEVKFGKDNKMIFLNQECSSELDLKCFINSICKKCKSKRFCRVCKGYETKLKRNCDHIVCSICISDGKCKKCCYPKCIKCKSKKLEELKLFNCRHYVCNKCSEKMIIKSKKECGHVVCNACFLKDECIICNFEQTCISCGELNDLCIHKYCETCRAFKSLCQCECDCGASGVLTLNKCYHAVCMNCAESNICKKCDRKPCSFCKVVYPNKTIHKCKKHLLCSNCYNPSICYACDPKNYCLKCKTTLANIYHCNHRHCINCLKGPEILCECFCKHCNDLYKPNNCSSNHAICECLARQNKCPVCDKCSSCGRQKKANNITKCKHKVCDICYENKFCGQCNNLKIVCSICNYKCSMMDVCEHSVCTECNKLRKCADCICDVCGRMQAGKMSHCGQNHKFCSSCSPNQICIKCSH